MVKKKALAMFPSFAKYFESTLEDSPFFSERYGYADEDPKEEARFVFTEMQRHVKKVINGALMCREVCFKTKQEAHKYIAKLQRGKTSAGIFWSWDCHNLPSTWDEPEYIDDYCVILKGKVADESEIDIPDTIYKNMYLKNRETEIQLKHKAPITIIDIENSDQKIKRFHAHA